MKRVFAFILSVLLILCCTACGQKGTADKKEPSKEGKKELAPVVEAAKIINEFQNEGAAVICWGDSLTESMAMPLGYTYPNHLQARIGNTYRVINAGVGGEDTNAILARANATDFGLKEDLNFASGEQSKSLPYNMFSALGEEINLKAFGNQLKTEKLKIGNNYFTLSFAAGTEYGFGTYTLTRLSSAPLSVKAGEKASFDYSDYYKTDYVNVVLMGENDKNKDISRIVSQYKKFAAKNENFIAIVPYNGEDMSKEFEAVFGNKALDIRKYFLNEGHKDYGVTLGKLDQSYIKRGMVPSVYKYKNNQNDVHLNELGYKILADKVYEKGVELGYWK